MIPKNRALLKRELQRINRVIDFAEDTRIADSFVVVRQAVNNLDAFVDGLISIELADAITQRFIAQSLEIETSDTRGSEISNFVSLPTQEIL
jgi:hypothetical protein